MMQVHIHVNDIVHVGAQHKNNDDYAIIMISLIMWGIL